MIWNILLTKSVLGSLVAHSWLMSELRTMDIEPQTGSRRNLRLHQQLFCIPLTCLRAGETRMESTLGWIVCLERHVETLTAGPVNAPLCGNRSFTDVIKLKIRSLGWALTHYNCWLSKRRNTGTNAQRSPSNTRGGDGRAATTNQGAPRTTGRPPGPDHRQGKASPLQLSEAAWPCSHLDFGLLASSTVRQHIPAVWSQRVCDLCTRALGNEYKKLIQAAHSHTAGDTAEVAAVCLWFPHWAPYVVTAKLYADVFSYALCLCSRFL